MMNPLLAALLVVTAQAAGTVDIAVAVPAPPPPASNFTCIAGKCTMDAKGKQTKAHCDFLASISSLQG